MVQFFLFLGPVLFFLSSCSGKPFKPCTLGGQSPHDHAHEAVDPPFRGTKRCFQVQDISGNTVNDGKYFEWYLDETLATEGEYNLGKKTGRWIEYDENGEKVSDKYFDGGKEISRP